MAAYWGIAAHSAYDMFSGYKYLSVINFFPPLGLWSGNFFLIAPFPDHCLLVPFYKYCVSVGIGRLIIFESTFGKNAIGLY